MNGSKGWLVPLTGAAFIVVAIIGFIVGGEPKDATHPATEIANWYIDNKNSVEISAFIGVAATILLVFFGAYLRDVLRVAAGGADMLSLVSFIGVVVVAIGFSIDSHDLARNRRARRRHRSDRGAGAADAVGQRLHTDRARHSALPLGHRDLSGEERGAAEVDRLGHARCSASSP